MQVLFDPKVLSFKELIRHYLKLFKPSRYPGEETSQYRAAIFYEGDEQKREAGEVFAEMGFDREASERLLEPAKTFYAAEEYHQKYYEKSSPGGIRR